jgi:polyisoprenoid-binding protein YceI
MATAVHPFEGTYEVDPNHSSFQFAVRHLDLSTFRASFADVAARLSADDDGLVLEGHARVESISIVDPDFREHVVRGTDFFEADEHPLITFRSTSVVLEDDGRATVSGDLVIRGVSRPVTAAGSYAAAAEDPFGVPRAALELRATVDRRNWDMDWQLALPGGGDALGWDVELTVHLELVGKP